MVPCDETTLGQLIDLAKDVNWLLKARIAPRVDMPWFHQSYVTLLKKKGLATPRGRVFRNELSRRFKDFYTPDLLRMTQSDFDEKDDHSWLAAIFRHPRKVFHPTRHLLVMRFLSGSPEGFFAEAEDSYTPFGEGPFPCLNPAATHFCELVITSAEVTSSSDAKRPIGTFRCGCGFVYQRSGPDPDGENIHRIDRMESFGKTWEKQLARLLENRLSVRETARRLRVDSKTILRHALELGICIQSRSKTAAAVAERACTPGEKTPIAEKRSKRQQWRNLCSAKPHLCRTTLRKISPGLFAWLHRWDRAWLRENSPAEDKSRHARPIVDWEGRDKEALSLAKVAVAQILAREKPKRISVSAVARAIDMLSLLQKHPEKLPLTWGYITAVKESVNDFRRRRVASVIRSLSEKGEELQAWRIARVAGLKKGSEDIILAGLNSYFRATKRPAGSDVEMMVILEIDPMR